VKNSGTIFIESYKDFDVSVDVYPDSPDAGASWAAKITIYRDSEKPTEEFCTVLPDVFTSESSAKTAALEVATRMIDMEGEKLFCEEGPGTD